MCRCQVFAHILEVLDEIGEFVEEFSGFCGNVNGVAVLLVVGPELRREAHNRNKVRGAHNNHLFVIGFAPEVGVAVHSCEISALVGHKHYHEVGRVFHMFLIGFGVEFGDVRFHRTEVFF